MIREFSEGTRDELKNIIQQIKDIELCAPADFVHDLYYKAAESTGNLNLDDFNNNIDEYHRAVLDKENATENKIDKIYQAVEMVDISYESIFKQYRASVQSQKDFVDKMISIIDPSQGTFTVDRVTVNLSLLAESVKIGIVSSQVEIMRNGTGDGNYNYDYIRELMSKDPEDVTKEEYEALIYIFNEMNDEQKEQFIKNSYIVVDEMPYREAAVTFYYEISPVFQELVGVYQKDFLSTISDDMIFSTDEDNKKKCDEYYTNFAILYTISTGFSSTSQYGVHGFDSWPNIQLKSDVNSGINSYTISLNAINPSTSLNGSSKEVTVFSFAKNLDPTIDECVKRLGDQLRPSPGVDTLWLIIETGVGMIPEVGDVIGPGLAVVDLINIWVDASADNKLIDEQQKSLDYGNVLSAIGAVGTVVMNENGTYVVLNLQINEELLNTYIKAYESITGNSVNFDAKDISEALKDSDFSNLGGFSEYYQWFCNSGPCDIAKYLETKIN